MRAAERCPRQWCVDTTAANQPATGLAYRFVYVNQEGFERNPPVTFESLAASSTENQTD